MKIAASFSIVLLALAPAVGCASSQGFDSVVSAVEHRYAVHAQRVPLMGLVNLCAWGASGGGVKGMHVAEFDNLTLDKDDDLNRLLREKLGDRWQPFVIERQANGEQDIIYVQPHGDFVRMFIADYSGKELDLVRLELNGDRLQQWVRNPAQSARSRTYMEKSRQPE